MTTYNNGTSVDIDINGTMIKGFDSTTAGEKTVTVKYSGFTVTFKVTVNKGSFTVEPQPGNMDGAEIDMSGEELYDAVLTPEDKTLIEQGMDIAVLMTVITINPSSVPANDVTAINNVMGDFELGCYIDVSLFKKYSNSNNEVRVTDTNSPMKISFKFPADILTLEMPPASMLRIMITVLIIMHLQLSRSIPKHRTPRTFCSGRAVFRRHSNGRTFLHAHYAIICV